MVNKLIPLEFLFRKDKIAICNLSASKTGHLYSSTKERQLDCKAHRIEVSLVNPCCYGLYAKETRILYLCHYKVIVAVILIRVIEILDIILELRQVLILVVIVKMVNRKCGWRKAYPFQE